MDQNQKGQNKNQGHGSYEELERRRQNITNQGEKGGESSGTDGGQDTGGDNEAGDTGSDLASGK